MEEFYTISDDLEISSELTLWDVLFDETMYIDPDIIKVSIKALSLNTRTYNLLNNSGIEKVEILLYAKPKDLFKIPGFGKACLVNTVESLFQASKRAYVTGREADPDDEFTKKMNQALEGYFWRNH